MQTDLQRRILANVLLNPQSEHTLVPPKSRVSMSTLVSVAFFATALLGLALLVISKLQGIP